MDGVSKSHPGKLEIPQGPLSVQEGKVLFVITLNRSVTLQGTGGPGSGGQSLPDSDRGSQLQPFDSPAYTLAFFFFKYKPL